MDKMPNGIGANDLMKAIKNNSLTQIGEESSLNDTQKQKYKKNIENANTIEILFEIIKNYDYQISRQRPAQRHQEVINRSRKKTNQIIENNNSSNTEENYEQQVKNKKEQNITRIVREIFNSQNLYDNANNRDTITKIIGLLPDNKIKNYLSYWPLALSISSIREGKIPHNMIIDEFIDNTKIVVNMEKKDYDNVMEYFTGFKNKLTNDLKNPNVAIVNIATKCLETLQKINPYVLRIPYMQKLKEEYEHDYNSIMLKTKSKTNFNKLLQESAYTSNEASTKSILLYVGTLVFIGIIGIILFFTSPSESGFQNMNETEINPVIVTAIVILLIILFVLIWSK